MDFLSIQVIRRSRFSTHPGMMADHYHAHVPLSQKKTPTAGISNKVKEVVMKLFQFKSLAGREEENYLIGMRPNS